MLSPRGQAGLEAKIFPRPKTRPRAFVLGMPSNFLFWPRENECSDGTGNHLQRLSTKVIYLLTLCVTY